MCYEPAKHPRAAASRRSPVEDSATLAPASPAPSRRAPASPQPAGRELARSARTGCGAMVPSREQPGAALGTGEAPPPGTAPAKDAALRCPRPSDDSEAAAEKVEVELAGPEPREPPEGGWGWLVMLAAMWCNGSVFGIQNSSGLLFVFMLQTFESKDDDKMVFKTGEAPSASRVRGASPAHRPGPACARLARGPDAGAACVEMSRSLLTRAWAPRGHRTFLLRLENTLRTL